MLESIKKLRDYISTNQRMRGWKDNLSDIADEIEREIAEKYMELPVDADGVPIRYGDKLSSDEMPGRAFTCFTCLGFNVTRFSGEPLWLVEWRYDGESGTSEYVSAKSCRHVKSRTVEDVLREFGKAYAYVDGECASTSVLISDCVDKLRDLLGGDAE